MRGNRARASGHDEGHPSLRPQILDQVGAGHPTAIWTQVEVKHDQPHRLIRSPARSSETPSTGDREASTPEFFSASSSDVLNSSWSSMITTGNSVARRPA